MYKVTLTIEDLENDTPEEAARTFLEIITRDRPQPLGLEVENDDGQKSYVTIEAY